MPYGRNQSQGQGHSREVDRQSPTGLIFLIVLTFTTLQIRSFRVSWNARLKQKCSWHDLMMSILLVLNSFMKNLSTTKSHDLISDFFRGQASRPYVRIGMHLLKISWIITSSDAIRPTLPNMLFAAFGIIQRALEWSRLHKIYTEISHFRHPRQFMAGQTRGSSTDNVTSRTNAQTTWLTKVDGHV